MTGSEYKFEDLRRLRRDHKLTMVEAGRRVGKTRMMIWYAEKGERCTDTLLRRLARLYGVRYKDLLHDEQPTEKTLAASVNDA